MKHALTIAFAIFALFLGAQNKQKSHFSIIKIDSSADLAKYQKAATGYAYLDNYRLYDQRRVIRFTDGKASIELFSAKELLETYGKPIAPGTIMDASKAREITFDIALDGNALKPQFVK